MNNAIDVKNLCKQYKDFSWAWTTCGTIKESSRMLPWSWMKIILSITGPCTKLSRS